MNGYSKRLTPSYAEMFASKPPARRTMAVFATSIAVAGLLVVSCSGKHEQAPPPSTAPPQISAPPSSPAPTAAPPAPPATSPPVAEPKPTAPVASNKPQTPQPTKTPPPAAGDTQRPPDISVTLGQEFELRVGGTAVVTGESLAAHFDRVVTDSRCPTNTTCIWAGDAVVRLLLRTTGGEEGMLDLHSIEGPTQEATFQRYRLRLVRLMPVPKDATRIAPGQYIATLTINMIRTPDLKVRPTYVPRP